MPRRGLDAEAVVSAGAALADRVGIERLTVAGLATELGVRAPSLYAHVDGLDDLRQRIGARGAHELAEAIAAAAAGRARRDALDAVAGAYRNYAREHPGSYAALQPARGESAEAAVEVVIAVLHGYGLEGDEAIHVARALRSALHGFVLLEAEGGFGIALSTDESFDRLVAVMDRGLAE
jgi:AcrR family transcriptional regulator